MKKIFINFDEKISSLILIIMLIITFVNVVGRYGFNASISFTDEITTSFFVLLCTLGAAIAAKRGAHLGLSFIRDMLPKKYHRYTNCFSNITGVIFSLILLYTGILMVIHEYEMGMRTIGLQWPEWIYGSFIPIGGAVMVYRFAEAAVKSLKKGENE